MNVQKEINRINNTELLLGLSHKNSSWHDEYRDSAYIYIGGLDYRLTEGDIICVFSQFGEVVDCNLVRDDITGKSKGFCFLAYEDQRSTILAVDNMNGAAVLGRNVTVDHHRKYRLPKNKGRNDDDDGKDTDEEYEIRRKLIWDYELYAPVEREEEVNGIQNKSVNISNISSSMSTNKSDDNETMSRIEKLMLKRRKQRQADKNDNKNDDIDIRRKRKEKDHHHRRRRSSKERSDDNNSRSSNRRLYRSRSRSPRRRR